jgi:signal transduction histidine kinase
VPDLYPDAIRVILTGQAGLQSAIDAIKLGVDDYLEKPVSELDLVKTIRNHLNNYLLKQDNKRLQEFVKQSHLRTSEITDLAFRSFNYHLTRLLTNDGDRREVVEAIRKARENINLLSQIYKINQGMVKGSSYSSVTPEELAQDAIAYVRGRNNNGPLVEKRQEVKVVSFEEGAELYGNRAVMRIVLERILENACKFSPEGSIITLTIRGHQFISSPDRTAQMVQPDLLDLLKRNFTILSITDAGTPTPEDFQNLLYVQEWQQPSSDREPTLKGLGLIIAQEYLLIMGGHLFIDSKVGHKGTTVHVAFPNDARGVVR